jgi:cation transport regulator ChaC
VYYFAYASNLDKRQMQECCPDCKPLFMATLHNYKLAFVGWTRQWRGGVATIRSFRGERVLGAIYEVPERDWSRLDKYEGYPDTYSKLKVIVTNEDGDPIEAVTYIKAGRSEETQPSPEYLAVIRQGYKDWGIV